MGEGGSLGLRVGLMGLLAVLVLVYVGAVSGWSAMYEILVDQGVFSELCTEGTDSCNTQTEVLEDIYIVSITMQSFFGPVGGVLLDLTGHNPTFIIGSLIQISSYLFIISSNSYAIFAGFVLLGAGGGILLVSINIFVLSLFRKQNHIVTAFASAIFDSSCLTFSVFYFLYEAGESFVDLFIVFASFQVVLTIITAYLQHLYSKTPAFSSDEQLFPGENDGVGHPRSIWYWLFSIPGLFLLFFPFLQYCRISWIFATIADQLSEVGDDGTYAAVASVVFGAGIIYVPVVMAGNYVLSFAVNAVLLDLIGALSMSLLQVNSLAAKIIACIFGGLHRTWLFSFILLFVEVKFPRKVQGRVYGAAMFFCGMSSFIQLLLIWVCNSVFDGDYSPGNYSMIAISALSLPLIWFGLTSSPVSQPSEPTTELTVTV